MQVHENMAMLWVIIFYIASRFLQVKWKLVSWICNVSNLKFVLNLYPITSYIEPYYLTIRSKIWTIINEQSSYNPHVGANSGSLEPSFNVG